MIHREKLFETSLLIRSSTCSYRIDRIKPGLVYMTISGQETGELGRAPLGEVAAEAAHHPPLRLFIDMTALRGITPPVSDDWTAWFRANQQSLGKVHALVDSPLVQLTVTVSQLLSRSGNLIRVHTEAATFEAALREHVPSFERLLPIDDATSLST